MLIKKLIALLATVLLLSGCANGFVYPYRDKDMGIDKVPALQISSLDIQDYKAFMDKASASPYVLKNNSIVASDPNLLYDRVSADLKKMKSHDDFIATGGKLDIQRLVSHNRLHIVAGQKPQPCILLSKWEFDKKIVQIHTAYDQVNHKTMYGWTFASNLAVKK